MLTLLPGCFLQHGTYRIEEVLGQGGFGVTYLATDINLQRKVAIKEFFPKDYCDRNEITRHITLGTQNTAEFVNRLKKKFLKEACNIAKFDYYGIIRIYAAFEENNTAYYVMDYIEGESLSAMVKRSGPLTEKMSLNYIEKVGKALEFVHARKINHLDVKPANIMIRRIDNTPVLIDFGLSKQYDSEGNQTSTMAPGFSHGFAPIEQYNVGGVKEFSPQTDIYSLAATLYYLLSGVIPPQATQLTDETLTFPASIPIKMITPISKAMSTSRRCRHATVGDFINDLKNVNGENDVTELKSLVSGDVETKMDSSKVDSGNIRKKLFIIVGAIILVIIGVFWGLNTREFVSKGVAAKTVVEMKWSSPLGSSVYTGEIYNDTLDSGEIKIVPNGKGVAKINNGKLAGAIYDGNFVLGEMEGQSTYTLSNGDVFIGTFHRNQFEEGKYIDKESGEYFEGTFRDMEPYKGKWYSANGEILEEI